ncbi:CHASE3 domain-containing protein [Usitatibacter palustris]|uniref:histidine kinase n=1 Tax=Usitatibacter palustris TaxID=2732487 RepID=A0A6M4H465_9PROT|nr:CHASE3 domain-containing protein [Usitatibacter palustris]QJR14306.1 Sensor histidine kinase RcsC [Usitatibacter palustris]
MSRGTRALWLGLALIVLASLGHLWLEIDRGTRVAPQLRAGPEVIAHTFEVITTAQALRRSLQDAERGQRGYLLSRDPSYLEPFRKAEGEVPVLFAKLKELTLDNPEQQRRWPILAQQIDIKMSELHESLAANDRGNPAEALKIMKTHVGREAMDSVNTILQAALQAERALASERLARAAEFEREGSRAAVLGGILTFGVLMAGVGVLLFAIRSLRAAESARQRVDERFRLLVQGVSDYAVYMLDPEGVVVEWNPGAERIKGYRAEEIIGQHFSRFYTDEQRAAGDPQRALERAVAEGRFEEDAERVRKDGTRFLASIVINPLRDRNGRLLGFAKITRDIDERVRRDQALAQYQKMDAIGQLTGGIAHDFNNLLHVIRNALELLEKRLGQVPPEARQYFDMLKRNAERATSLTHRLLAFSRRQVLDPKPINPNTLIVDVTTLLQQALGESVEVETVLGAGVWWIMADANQLETAILNLALNARDAMSGGGKLTVEISNAYLDETYAGAHTEVKAGQYVMVAVSDTGTGMTPEVAAKAFEPFFTTKEVGRGTGLGLSQVYGFVKQSGGHAKIYSEPGEGTTVKLYLPRLTGSGVPQAETRAPSVVHGKGQGTILLVEDDEDVREFTTAVLREMGYDILSAGEAVTALRLLDEHPRVDLLFTDIGLPGGVNGRQLADAALDRRPGLRVLFMTGYTRNAVIHHGRLDPGVDLLVKPFTQTSLADKVKRMLESVDPA